MRRLSSAIVLMLSVPASAGAQDVLALDTVVQTALTHDRTIRAAEYAADSARSEVTAARSSLFPRVVVTEGWQRGDQPVFVFSSLLASRRFAAANFAIDALNHPDPTSYFHANAGLEQLLFDGGARRAQIRVSTLQSEIADVARSDAALSVVSTVTDLFARLLSLQSTARATDGALAAAREDLLRAERRRDAGMASDADVLTLMVHLSDLEQRRIQADAEGDAVRAQLNRSMGEPIERRFQALEPALSSEQADGDLSTLIAEAERQRPDLRRAAAVVHLAEAGQQQSRAAVWPQAVAQAAFDVSGTRLVDRASSWLVGAEFRWQFNVGGAERARIAAAAASASRARTEADDARARAQVEIVSALGQLKAARARQALARSALDQARESERIIRDRFDAGVAPVNDVLRASAAVLDAEAQRATAVGDAISSTARLHRAVGRAP